MASQCIKVTAQYDAQTQMLAIDPAQISLGDGQWVYWDFKGLEEGVFGFISFRTRFGPFHSLRSYDRSSVLGKGNIGPANQNSYPYTAMVLTPGGSTPLATALGRIDNQATGAETSPEVLVYYNSESGTIQCTPNPLPLNRGDTATWYFMNLPADAFASFQFDVVAPGMNEAFGPFVAFYALAGNNLVNVRVSGTGFASMFPEGEPAPTSFTYYLQVRDSQGKLLAHDEPAIDNLGPPAPPTEPTE